MRESQLKPSLNIHTLVISECRAVQVQLNKLKTAFVCAMSWKLDT